MNRATLLITQGVDQGARFEIEGERTRIGRGPLNEICLRDHEASRSHCCLEYRTGEYRVTDLASSNGTYLNGRAIRSAPIQSGDLIQLGRTLILFQIESDEDERKAAAASNVEIVARNSADDHSQIVGNVSVTDPRISRLTQRKSSPVSSSEVLDNLRLLYQIAEETSRPVASVNEMLQRILDLILNALGGNRGCMLIKDSESGELTPLAFSPQRSTQEEPMPVSRTIVDFVVKSRAGVRTSDARTDSRFDTGQSILQAGVREAMCAPIFGRNDFLGVIYIDNTISGREVIAAEGEVSAFNDELLSLLVAIGRQVALAIENHQYQRALVKAERLGAMGQTIAILSHHIKNILQGVKGGSYLVQMGLDGHDETMFRKGWGIVERNQDRIYNLVMDMLSFSKERQPAYTLSNLNSTILEVQELMQGRAAESETQLEVSLSEQIPPSMFDPEGIHRAVLNIVTNALDAVDGTANAKIVLQTAIDREHHRLVVTIADNGPGIPEEVIPKLFNIFESTKGSRGTGLGLSVSQKIIREHGGDIYLTSREGVGTTFRLEWPYIEEDKIIHESQTLA